MTSPHDLVGAFSNLIEQAFSGTPQNGRCGMELNHPQLDYPILIPFSSRQYLSAEKVLGIIEQVQQSNEDVDVCDMDVRAVVVTPPSASGIPQPINLNEYLEEHCGANGCLFKIRNSDTLCVVRSVVCGMARAKRNDSDTAKKHWFAIRKGDHARCTAQKKAAMALIKRCGLSSTGPHDLTDVKKIQEEIGNEFQISVWRVEVGLARVFSGPAAVHSINLLWARDHSYLITSMPAFMKSNYYCTTCNVSYTHRGDHRCPSICKYCETRGGACVRGETKYCDQCRVTFPNSQCHSRHLAPAPGSRKGGGSTPLSPCQRNKVCQCC